MSASRLPLVLPKVVPSLLGPVSVVLDPDLMEEGNFGCWDPTERTITVQAELKPIPSWVTLWHETMHMLLADSGLANQMCSATQEALCDSFGTFMTQAMQKGFVSVASLSKETK